MMNSLISLDRLADVAINLINKLSNAVGWIVTHETPEKIAVDTYIKDIQNSSYDPITKAALISQAKKTIKEYCNQYDIISKAIEMLEPTAQPNSIDSDWLGLFADRARLISDSDFQRIWANLLAEECNYPGTIPKALLYTLEQMDKHMAIAFMKVASVSVKYIDEGKTEYSPVILINEFSSYYKSIGITLDDLIDLQSLGLIKIGDGFTNYSIECSAPVIIHYHNQECKVSDTFAVGNIVYTRIGEALCSAVYPEKVEDFFDKICIPLWKKEHKNKQ